ncbi:hypothetical protein PIB30_092244, partial [Stylosanthes scabra]|nr:hypothetical protein [Stylosanthes scabra]
LYKEFGRNGYVKDIFVSRKQRVQTSNPFAFVRFQGYGGAIQAIKRVNGTTWRGNKLLVNLSKFDRRNGKRVEVSSDKRGPIVRQKWVEVKKRSENKGSEDLDVLTRRKTAASDVRKEVVVDWSEEQRDRLNRSLLGVSVKPIDFRKTMNLLLDGWMGLGVIECRDVGLDQCLIKFSSPEIKDDAMENELINSAFDEVRPHWEFFSSLSRRVWIEIMGLPVGLWCSETINTLAKLWGKIIKMDDRTEESKSFTIARFLVDCFQWEMVNKWITVKVKDRVFEIFAKEFGSEVYSVQSHPDLEEVSATSMEEVVKPISISVVVGTLVEEQPAVTGHNNSNSEFIIDPLLDAIINCNSNNVHECNHGGVIAGVEAGDPVTGKLLSCELCASSLQVVGE